MLRRLCRNPALLTYVQHTILPLVLSWRRSEKHFVASYKHFKASVKLLDSVVVDGSAASRPVCDNLFTLFTFHRWVKATACPAASIRKITPALTLVFRFFFGFSIVVYINNYYPYLIEKRNESRELLLTVVCISDAPTILRTQPPPVVCYFSERLLLPTLL